MEVCGHNRNLKRTSNAQSVILSLPNELILAIFKRVCDFSYLWFAGLSNTDKAKAEFHRQQVPAEIKISHVCHLWRSLALDCSELWSTFYQDYSSGWENPLSRLATYLERSRERLLDLRFSIPIGSRPRIEDMMNLISPHAARWQRISICVHDREYPELRLIQNMGPYDVDNLETFEIIVDDDNDDYSEGISDLSFWKHGAAPKLTRLHVDCILLESCLSIPSNITVLQLDNHRENSEPVIPWSTYMSIFKLPCLVSLSLADFNSFRPPRSQESPIIVPNLRHLRFSSEEHLAFVLIGIQAPKLELLIISWMRLDADYVGSAEIMAFPSLKTIGLIKCDVEPGSGGLYRLCRAMPNVTHIMVADEYPEWKSHMLVSDSVPLWPNLDTLSFGCTKNFRDARSTSSKGHQLLATITQRETRYNKHCTYKIETAYLDALKQTLGPGIWTPSVAKGNFHEVVPIDTRSNRNWMVWPPCEEAGFHYSSENSYTT